jgi:hypothetical protein
MKGIALGMIIILLIVGAISIALLVTRYKDNTENITAVDGKNYKVRTDGLSDESANRLATLVGKVNGIIKYMIDNDLPTPEIAHRLQYRWRKCEVRETASGEDSAAYTVNKGEEMRVCLKNDKGEFENENTMMFVVLHELGHMMSVSYGHNDEFKDNFQAITEIASKLGYYTPEDFGSNPVNYCGTTITSTPCDWGHCPISKNNGEIVKDRP